MSLVSFFFGKKIRLSTNSRARFDQDTELATYMPHWQFIHDAIGNDATPADTWGLPGDD